MVVFLLRVEDITPLFFFFFNAPLQVRSLENRAGITMF